ncbi:hypothetical protein PSEUDO8Z_160089 [Pseudomonas sp. 8Z]|nr:hypothetical protein PSEUDO8Z_160089 [Pseudomonas sp. 8Z]
MAVSRVHDRGVPYLLKAADLSVRSREELNAIALPLNMRPRKRFDFKCLIEVMCEVMEKTSLCSMVHWLQFNNRVALSSCNRHFSVQSIIGATQKRHERGAGCRGGDAVFHGIRRCPDEHDIDTANS